MDQSVWTVTATSYLTSLTIGKGSSVVAPEGKKLTMKVNGKKQEDRGRAPTPARSS